MEVFHVGDKVFLDDVNYKYCKKIDIDTEGNQKVSLENMENCEYGKIIAIDIENNSMEISSINDKLGMIFNVHIDSPHIHKIDFLPKDRVVIHDLLKDYCNKKGIVDAYDRTIDRYRVMIDGDESQIWFAPFELTLEDNLKDNDDWSKRFKLFSSCNPIKAKLSEDGKRGYEHHFGVRPLVDANGRTKFDNLAQLMEVFDSTFFYGDKYMLEDDEILVKVMVL